MELFKQTVSCYKMRRQILIFILLFPIGLLSVHALPLNVSVKKYGAKGDGKTDDRAAIQTAIDAVHNSGGGTVLFPAGTYIIKALPYEKRWQPQIKVWNNTTLKGSGMYKSIIKTSDDSKKWDAIISGDSINGFAMYDLGMDLNGKNNPVVNQGITAAPGYYHTPVNFANGSNISVRRCNFTNHSGVWAVYIHGKAENVIIDSCIFDNIGGWTEQDFDVSTIRVDGRGPVIVSNNIMKSRLGPNSTGVRTAVEIHGSNEKFINNTISGFREALNVCAGGDGLKRGDMSVHQYYGENKIIGCGTAFIIWHIRGQGLDDVIFENNDITIDMSWNSDYFWPEPEWQDYGYPDYSAIIMSGTPGWPYPPLRMSNLKILNNKINYVNAKQGTERSFGISLGFSYAGNAEAPLEKVEISGNTIVNPFSGGVYIDAVMTDIRIANNTIIDPSQNLTREDLKCAIKLAGRARNLVIENNFIKDTRMPHVINSIIYNEAGNLGGCSYNDGNKAEILDGTSIPIYQAAAKYLGKPWR